MEENVELKYKSMISIIVYLIGFYLFGSIIIMLLIGIYKSSSGFSFETILNALNDGTTDEKLSRISVAINTLSNLIIYSILCISLSIYMRKVYVYDAIKVKEKPKAFILRSIIYAALFYGVIFGVDKLIGLLVHTSSNNQETIEKCFSYNPYAFIMFLVTVLGGPIIEELIFRKCIFNVLKRFKKWVPILVSTIAFALPHMISTRASIGDFMLLSIPYLISGLGLALIYNYSDENIYVTMFVHFVNNLIACLLIIF